MGTKCCCPLCSSRVGINMSTTPRVDNTLASSTSSRESGTKVPFAVTGHYYWYIEWVSFCTPAKGCTKKNENRTSHESLSQWIVPPPGIAFCPRYYRIWIQSARTRNRHMIWGYGAISELPLAGTSHGARWILHDFDKKNIGSFLSFFSINHLYVTVLLPLGEVPDYMLYFVNN